MKNSIFILTFIFLSSLVTQAQVTQEWVKRFNNPPSADDYVKFLKLDGAGNIYVAGESISSTGRSCTLLKYSSSGVLLWSKSPDNAYGVRGMTVDGSGNVYIISPRFNGITTDYLTVKYNNAGIMQWAVTYNGPANDNDLPDGVAVDASGNVYVTGRSAGEGNINGAIIKYNSSGAQQWVYRDEGSIAIGAYILIDAAGNIYTAGTYRSSYESNQQFYVVKYSPSGIRLWRRMLDVSGFGSLTKGMVIDNSENVIVTGSVFTSLLKQDYYTFKYDSSGALKWEVDFDGGGQEDDVKAIGSDASGNIYVTGYSKPSASLPNDCVTIKYNSEGVQQWMRRYDSGNSDGGAALSLDTWGNVYISGYTYVDPWLFAADFLTIKYTPSGTQQWVKTYNGPGNFDDLAVTNAVDAADNVYVTGISTGFGTRIDFATIKYSQGSSVFWVVKERIDNIISKIDSLVLFQIMPPNYGNMLNNNLTGAIQQLELGHPNVATIRMRNFQAKVNLLVQLQILPFQIGQSLISDANEVIGMIQNMGNGNSVLPVEEPHSFALEQNYPNPFNPSTRIHYEIPFDGMVSLKVYDLVGREVATLVNENLTAGKHEAVWNASGFSSGIYFYKLVAEIDGNKFNKTMKMILVK